MINSFINTLKWPVAFLMAWSLPASLLLLWNFITTQQYSIHNIPPILIGLAGYFFLWLLIFKRPMVGSYLTTLEHECTHALFAILTGHSVKGMHVTAHDGGQVQFKGGEGNWLITIAPYFFPTITVLLLSVRIFIEQNYWLEVAIGGSIAFHITSSYLETHGAQTDLQRVGRFFSLCFLPTANILTYTFIGKYLQSGWQGIQSGFIFLAVEISAYSVHSYHYIYSFVTK